MFEALIITLREGVEAALVLSIALSLLKKRGIEHLRWALFAGTGVALVLSVIGAVLVSRLTFNQELAEGIVMLIGAGLVISLVWWMWISAPHMKSEIESGVARATGRGDFGNALGLFVFALGMVFREGVETAIFLSAAGFNSEGLGLWLGAIAGLAIAAVFGVMFARGAIRVPLKPFFSLTSAVLLLIAVQLLIGAFHELSEAEVLPASRAEMAVIGPLVKNELLLFTLTVALAAGWLLFGPGRSTGAAAQAVAPGPDARLERAAQKREGSVRRGLGLAGLVVVVLLGVAFVQGSKIPGKAPATALTLADSSVSIAAAALADGHMHFFETTLPEGPVRFFAIQVNGKVQTCFDACEICGDIGYFEDGASAVCRNCTSPIVLASLGRTGGCNPIPLAHTARGETLVIAAANLRAVLPHLKGR